MGGVLTGFYGVRNSQVFNKKELYSVNKVFEFIKYISLQQ